MRHLACLLILLTLTACLHSPSSEFNAVFDAQGREGDEVYDLSRIQETGELIVATLTGPESYYEYRGRILGLQYNLAEHFAQHIGTRLRVETFRDTAALLEALAAAEADVAAYPLPTEAIRKAGLLPCAATDSLGEQAWAVREDTPSLASAIDAWYDPVLVRKLVQEETNQESERRSVRRKVRARYLSRSEGIISEYDNHFKAAARATGWDWRLIAAQCYQESGFDPDAVSWAGAQGLMQIMPATAKHLGLAAGKVYDPAENVAAAARYINELSASFREIRDRSERIKFVLAAYNGGYFHICDAMALCRKDGKNPTRWENVSPYVLRLSEPRYYRDPVVKYGYMVGSETCDYVSSIMELWRAYGGDPHAAGQAGQEGTPPRKATKKNRYSKTIEILTPDDAEFNIIDEQ